VSSVAGFSLDSNDVSVWEAEESPLFEAVVREWLLEAQQVGKRLGVQ
jgi:hypothetical protein